MKTPILLLFFGLWMVNVLALTARLTLYHRDWLGLVLLLNMLAVVAVAGLVTASLRGRHE